MKRITQRTEAQINGTILPSRLLMTKTSLLNPNDDEEGTEIGSVPAEDGDRDDEDIPGNYFDWGADFLDHLSENGPEHGPHGEMGKSIDEFEWDD